MLNSRSRLFGRFAALITSSLILLGVAMGVMSRADAAEPAWPADSDSCWTVSGTVKTCVTGSTLYMEPVSGNLGTFGRLGYRSYPWSNKTFTSIKAQGTLGFMPSTSLSYAFANNPVLTDISGLESWQTGTVTNMSDMFESDSKLASLTGIQEWDTSHVMNMAGMFDDDASLSDISALKNWKTTAVTDMKSMFGNDGKISDISTLQNWDTSKVTDMASMFFNDSGFVTLDALGRWQTGNVTDMGSMFSGARGLTDLSALKNWTLNKSLNVHGMFDGIPSWRLMGIPSAVHNGSLFASADASLPYNTANVVPMNGSGKVAGDMTTLNAVESAMKKSHASYPNSLVYMRGAGGTSVSHDYKIVKKGDPAGTLPAATRTRYKFDGLCNRYRSKVNESFVPDKSQTLTSHGTRTTYTIILDSKGGSVTPTSVKVNAGESTDLSAPVRNGYIFRGWKKADGTAVPAKGYTPKGNITLYAHWTHRIETMPATGGIGIGAVLGTLFLLVLVIVGIAQAPVLKHAA